MQAAGLIADPQVSWVLQGTAWLWCGDQLNATDWRALWALQTQCNAVLHDLLCMVCALVCSEQWFVDPCTYAQPCAICCMAGWCFTACWCLVDVCNAIVPVIASGCCKAEEAVNLGDVSGSRSVTFVKWEVTAGKSVRHWAVVLVTRRLLLEQSCPMRIPWYAEHAACQVCPPSTCRRHPQLGWSAHLKQLYFVTCAYYACKHSTCTAVQVNLGQSFCLVLCQHASCNNTPITSCIHHDIA